MWARLRELFACYPSARGEDPARIIARMDAPDRDEALELVAVVAPTSYRRAAAIVAASEMAGT